MDLTTIKPSERTIEIEHPATGQPIGLRVTLLSIDDDRMKRVKRGITDESLKLQAKGKNFKSDEIDRNTNTLMFAGTLGWQWYNPTGNEGDEGYDPDATCSFNGEQPTYNQKNFLAVTGELKWVANQIQEAIGETKAFFDNSKPS